jgi:UDP-N-acetyl-D-galactosamine dehydrogenase
VQVQTNTVIAIIGLGYVGMPLAVEFGKKYPTIGFDISRRRILELRQGVDLTLEATRDELEAAERLVFSTDFQDLRRASVYIITVPTPIDKNKQPDLLPLKMASETIGKVLKKGDVVIYESTVYPGATEEFCVPLLEQESGLKFNEDFFAGYSPERVNPGDKSHRLTSIVKVTSGSTPETAEFVDALYASIVPAGTHKASSIRVAEAAKVIENTQRDLNIALMNEFAIIFKKLGIDTQEVIAAASTKWNFLRFQPGLVGGHCIGVDPYYLTHKAEAIGYHPEIILAGRRINDNMGGYVVGQLVKRMLKSRIQVENSNVLIMGLAFKENCPDIRNTKVVDIINGLQGYNVNVDVYDPWVIPEDAEKEYCLHPLGTLEAGKYDAIVVAVAHRQFADMGGAEIRKLGKQNHVLYDLKYLLDRTDADMRL